MSEKDLGLKADIRRLFWGMGFSTRIDVPMRAFVPPARSRTAAGIEEYTDLDVLAIGMSPDFRVDAVIADCKTSLKRATERMFWLRGLGDFFGVDHAYLVRAGDVPAAVRQLAARLDISVVAPEDLKLLQRGHASSGEHLDVLFDASEIASYRAALTGLDKRLNQLLEYRQFDFWVYDEHLNLQQVVAHLFEARKILSAEHRIHRALFCDYAWLFALSITRAVEHIRRAHLRDIDAALQEYLFGGQLGLREKERMAAVLRRVAGRESKNASLADVLPPYYPALLELVTRFVHRPQVLMPVLRYAEWTADVIAAGRSVPVAVAFGERFNPVAAKLLSDIVGFLVAAADLEVDLRDGVRALLEPPSNEERQGSAAAEPAPVENGHSESGGSAPSSDGSSEAAPSQRKARASRNKKNGPSSSSPPAQTELLGEP
jgi:hypothetical protein